MVAGNENSRIVLKKVQKNPACEIVIQLFGGCFGAKKACVSILEVRGGMMFLCLMKSKKP